MTDVVKQHRKTVDVVESAAYPDELCSSTNLALSMDFVMQFIAIGNKVVLDTEAIRGRIRTVL